MYNIPDEDFTVSQSHVIFINDKLTIAFNNNTI